MPARVTGLVTDASRKMVSVRRGGGFEVLIPDRFEAGDVTMPGDQGHYPGSLASRNELLHADRNPGQARGIHAGGLRIDLSD